MHHDSTMPIRVDLLDRIDAIAGDKGRSGLATLCMQLHDIRSIARRSGLEPLERMTASLEDALARQGHGASLLSCLDLMRDAARCEDSGPGASATYMGALSLRLGV